MKSLYIRDISFKKGVLTMNDKIDNYEPSDLDKIQGNLELDKCVTAPHPEMVRNTNSDEPCDDD